MRSAVSRGVCATRLIVCRWEKKSCFKTRRLLLLTSKLPKTYVPDISSEANTYQTMRKLDRGIMANVLPPLREHTRPKYLLRKSYI